MNSEEEIKRKMLEKRMGEQTSEKQMEDTLGKIMFQVLDTRARERLNNLKIVKPEIATQLQMYLAQLHQSGQLREKITDEQLVMILKKLTEKRDIQIRRR